MAMQCPCRSREGGRDRRSGSFLASAVDPRRPPTRPGGGGLGSARGPGFAVASRRLRSGYLVERLEVCWPSLIPAPDGSPPSSPPVAPLSFPPFPAARWFAPCGRSKNGGKGRGGPKGAGNRSAAMQKRGRLWSPAPPSAAPFLLAARQSRATSTAQVFLWALRFCAAPAANWPFGPLAAIGAACPGFAVARAAASLGPVCPSVPAASKKGAACLSGCPLVCGAAASVSCRACGAVCPWAGRSGLRPCNARPSGKASLRRIKKAPPGPCVAPAGPGDMLCPIRPPLGASWGLFLALPGIFDPAPMHPNRFFPLLPRPGSLLGAAGVRAVSFRGLSPFPGSVLRAGSDLRRDAPQIRPAPTWARPALPVKSALPCHMWPNPSPAYPRPCRGFAFLAESFPSIPPGPPFLPPPRSGGGQGGLVVLGNKSACLATR